MSGSASKGNGAMTGRERLRAVLAGQKPDQIPTSVWLHNFAREADADSLVAETLRLQEAFRFDFLKPQSPANSAGSLWGAEVSASKRADEWPVLTKPGVWNAGDLDKITRKDVTGQLAAQWDVMKRVRAKVGPEVPIVGTIFAPMMVMALMHDGGKNAALALIRDEPQRMERALGHISETLCDFARGLLAAGVDGVFYATTVCNRGEMTDAEHERFHAPFDKAILDACSGGWMNILHLCGPQVEVGRFLDAAPPIVSWELGANNPTLTKMRELTGKVVLSGVPGKPRFGNVTVDELRSDVRAAAAEMDGRNLIIGPGCSINPGVEDARIGHVVDEVRRIGAGRG